MTATFRTCDIRIINRSDAEPPAHRWTVEEQAPAGNWVKSLGTHDAAFALEYAKHSVKVVGRPCRVVDELNGAGLK